MAMMHFIPPPPYSFGWTYPLSSSVGTFTHRLPPIPHAMTNLMHVFDSFIWISLVASILCLGLTFVLFEKFHQKKNTNASLTYILKHRL